MDKPEDDDYMTPDTSKSIEIPEHIMQFFTYGHLPEHLQKISKRFSELAEFIMNSTPKNPERTKSLNKLLEAKDAAVRAALAK